MHGLRAIRPNFLLISNSRSFNCEKTIKKPETSRKDGICGN
ncbi:hypothetical protein LEP1GSC133_4770 [Leptospira borgpetersenii serovar Pomona str. 200901868]|uniref:Uncharacterized protein n=1 Tax=Leptospira borgpetersenii serovar Pomona str. 200901868 TaxID=1192866 RepID=M6W7V9_LEPBO|nr:hypothetical protein LEP1GSC133_4770 [Leptospira borgpetersenii serovar Pomona str. 200901868]